MAEHVGRFVMFVALWGLIALWATPASAQPPASSVFDWTGFYLGANVGGAWKKERSTLSIENDANNYFNPAVVPEVQDHGSVDFNDSGFTGGVQLGYNRQMGSFVWGVELDFNYLDLSTRRGSTFRYSTTNTPYTLTVQEDTDWLLTARPRVGWALDRFLLYLTGGIAASHSDFKQTFDEPPFTPRPESVSVSRTMVGWTVGAGLEFALGHNWSARAEYLYARFGGTDIEGRLGGANGASLAPGNVDGAKFTNSLSPLELHLVRGSVNYHFR
jgi:outer membrane immunogenic protein